MVQLSELTTAEEVRERDMADPAFRAEYERTRLATTSPSGSCATAASMA